MGVEPMSASKHFQKEKTSISKFFVAEMGVEPMSASITFKKKNPHKGSFL
jgi:hypothetical protein